MDQIEEVKKVKQLRGKFPLAITKLFISCTLMFASIMVVLGILMVITCKRELGMEFAPYGLGLWTGLPTFLTGWLAFFALDTPDSTRVMLALVSSICTLVVNVVSCVAAPFDHLDSSLGPHNYYLTLIFACVLGASIPPLVGLVIISMKSYCQSARDITTYPALAKVPLVQSDMQKEPEEPSLFMDPEPEPVIATNEAVNITSNLESMQAIEPATPTDLATPGRFSAYLSGKNTSSDPAYITSYGLDNQGASLVDELKTQQSTSSRSMMY